jgi:ribonuclease G
VQVAKDAIGTKGPRVTCHISLPGRHLVFMPTHDHVGISRRITDEEERARLRETLHALKPEGGGFVVRTVSAGLSEDKLKEDVDFLVSLWADVKARAEGSEAPALVQPELDLVERIARDSFTDDVNAFIVDDDETFERLKRFMALRDPSLVSRIAMHDEPEPVFEHHGVETELQRAMGRRVWLKSGGYLVIDQAEALTAIDVNTGRFVGKRNLEETILKTNLEAVKEVAYQLRLRNIGGMAIIDFIDMEVPEHRERVLTELEEALKGDKARCNVVKMSELGLVEMTRQRTRESLGRQLTETCWYCEGRGHLKSKRTLVYEIFRSLERQAARFSEPVVVVHAHPEVVDVIYDEEPVALGEIETKLDKRVIVRPRGSFHQEQYDIFGTSAEAAGGQGQRPRRGGRG